MSIKPRMSALTVDVAFDEADDFEDRVLGKERRPRRILPLTGVRKSVSKPLSCIILDPVSVRIADEGGTARLSPAEFIIMDNLFRANGHFVSTDVLIPSIWRNADREPDSPLMVLSVFIYRIRKKMVRIGSTATIESGWRLGYRLVL